MVTKRLRLRSFRDEDWSAVHAYTIDPETVRYVPGELPSEEETQETIHSWMNGLAACPPHYDFAVTLLPHDWVIGWCCIQISSSHTEVGELMYVFNRDFWGQGYATESTRAMVDFGFWELKLHRIFATCRPENAGSWRVLEKLGMQREGLLRENTYIHGKWCDSFLYAMLADDWKSMADISSERQSRQDNHG